MLIADRCDISTEPVLLLRALDMLSADAVEWTWEEACVDGEGRPPLSDLTMGRVWLMLVSCRHLF